MTATADRTRDATAGGSRRRSGAQGGAGGATPAAPPPRPAGGVVWFHAGHAAGPGPLLGVMRRVALERPDLSLLLTSTSGVGPGTPGALAPRCLPQSPPADTETAIVRFLDHWRPDAALWAGPLDAIVRPRTLAALHRRGVPVMLAGAGDARRSIWRWWRRPSSGALGAVSAALVDAPGAAAELQRLGMPRDRLQVAGELSEEADPPPHDEKLRARMAAHLGGRPIWFAAHLLPDEEGMVLRAHEASLRASHRLLLVLAPADPAHGPALARRLLADGRAVALRSSDEMPDLGSQIVVADRPGETGLWYRLAPVSFLGGSLVPGGGQDPGPAAALGSAILHGPHVARHLAAYERLARAGGARLVSGAEALSATLTRVIQPEEAARMAHAAWEIGSAGAEVAERAVALLRPLLPPPAAP